ncbi:glycosyltransferase family 2 protein [Microbaculum marinum]|uniref:Glycosyltransferase family 2 protein n=1 Tax=Microbaculum marinum TaxID=1764581 RepID=A0AAW9S034_9HYPH
MPTAGRPNQYRPPENHCENSREMGPTFAICATLRESRNNTLAFVRYHARLGADRLFLFFDDPGDPAIAELAHLPFVTCIGCDETHWSALTGNATTGEATTGNATTGEATTGYATTGDAGTRTAKTVDPRAGDIRTDFLLRQKLNTKLALESCRAAKIDWLIPIDGDELLYGDMEVRAYLASLPDTVDVVRVMPLEAVHVRGDVRRGPFAATLYKVLPTSATEQIARRIYAPIAAYSCDGFLAHRVGKSFLRARTGFEGIGVHRPLRDGSWREEQTAAELFILHHDAMQFGAWKLKWQGRTRDGLYFGMGPEREAQAAEFARRQEQDRQGLLHRFFTLTKTLPRGKIRMLKEHGLLRDILIDRAVFQSPLPGEAGNRNEAEALHVSITA